MRKKRLVIVAAIIVIVVGGGIFVSSKALEGPSLTPAQIAARAAAARARKLIATEKRDVKTAATALSFALPTAKNAPAPVVTASPFTTPLGSRQVLGFVPYYTLSELDAADFADTSTLCYFGLQIQKGGTIESPTGFISLATPTFASFVSSAHSASDQVLLTVSAFSKTIIDSIARHPAATAAKLVAEVSPLVATYGLQGVDLDIEGRWASDRAGFTTFVRDFSTQFRANDASRVIIVDTFPQSAGDAHSFYNFKALSPLVNAYFIMAYAMESTLNASANSPAFAPSLGLSSVQTLIQYTKLVKPSKLILGLPFYGFDFPTESARPGAFTSTPDPEAVTYSAVVGVGRPALWDSVSETAFSSFREGMQWHETWFDDPTSIALKVALANEFRTVGTGVWALGMEGGDPEMLIALDGGSPPKKTALAQ